MSLLWRLRPAPRVAAASLAGLPFLAASFLAQSAFKETAMALFVLAFTAVMALATEPGANGRPDLGRRPALGAAVVLVLGGIFAYSLPALAWFGLIAAGGLAIAVWRGYRVDWGALREAAARHRGALIVAVIVVLGVAIVSVGRIGSFVDRIGDVSASTGRLSSPIFPGEGLGIWPEGDFRIVRGEVSGALIATAIGALAVVLGAVQLWRRGASAALAALGAAAAIYVGARLFSSIYVEAKALAVMAPLVVVVALGGLLGGDGRSRGSLALRILGVTFLIGAAISTFLALRATPVGFEEKGEELEQLAEQVDGESVVFLGVDRFGGYWLRSTLMRSPGGYVPAEVKTRAEKVWQQGTAMDLDTLGAGTLDGFDYAITTTAPYQSSPPPNFTEVDRTDSYVLWERTDETPRTQVLKEGGNPGRILEAGESAFISLACRRGSTAPGNGRGDRAAGARARRPEGVEQADPLRGTGLGRSGAGAEARPLAAVDPVPQPGRPDAPRAGGRDRPSGLAGRHVSDPPGPERLLAGRRDRGAGGADVRRGLDRRGRARGAGAPGGRRPQGLAGRTGRHTPRPPHGRARDGRARRGLREVRGSLRAPLTGPAARLTL